MAERRLKHFGWGREGEGMTPEEEAFALPAKVETQRLLNLMRDEGVLIGSEGLHSNILKLRPPIVFSREHSDMTIAALDRAFQRL